MYFKKLKIEGWQQFQSIDIDFHDRLTVLTGANASGKTTLLNLLSTHCGWESNSLATPKRDKKSKAWKWVTGLFSAKNSSRETIGSLLYSNDHESMIGIPLEQNQALYGLTLSARQEVKSFFVPSHRSVFRYQKVTAIPTDNTINRRQAFDKVANINKTRYSGGDNSSSSYHIKEALISWNIFGQGNADMEANEALHQFYTGFQEVLKKVLPESLGFKKFVIRNAEVVLVCDSGDFIIDASSGGISAVIDLAWQIYFYSTEEEPSFTVIIDEVENHLHPTMQRHILPNFLDAFPEIRFIVSTHSPLIVGSVKDSTVYVLRYNEKNKIISEKLDFINKAKTASEILDEVLGVSFTMATWVEESLNQIISEHSKAPLTKESFSIMHTQLKDIGLERIMPEALFKLIEYTNDQAN